MIEINGRVETLAEWCRIYNCEYSTVRNRIERFGATPKEALELGKGSMQNRYEYKVGENIFHTMQEVSNFIGISKNACRNRFESKNYDDWVKYAIIHNI